MFSQTIASLEKFDNPHDFERMCADILNASGYKDIVLIAPRGGSDWGKDVIFTTQSGKKGVACVTLRKDIENKFEEDFSKREVGEFDTYILFCTAYLTASQKRKFSQYCQRTLHAEFIPKDIETLRSELDSSLLQIREKYLHIAPGKEKLTIAVASPGDVEEELDILEKVARELNKGTAKEYGLHIEISCWETNTFPSFHIDGAQGTALNIEDCELLIGIFWKRFGTPTTDAQSSPEHEIRKAYKAWKRNQQPQIMLYFNKNPYAPRSKGELELWGQVLEFQDEILQEGLSWSYTEKSQFERLVRTHLAQFIRKRSDLSQKSFNNIVSTSSLTPTHKPPSIDRQIALWLENKGANKKRTAEQYGVHMIEFREYLHKYGFDLNSEDEEVISSLLVEWANSGKVVKIVSDLTFNQRISAVRSFYTFACDHHWMRINPVEKVKRRKEKRRGPNYEDNILNLDTIKETIRNGLKKINRNTLLGKRDFSFLTMLCTTGKRISEIKNLTCGDINIQGDHIIVNWGSSETGKGIYSPLSPDVSWALIEYLEGMYGNNRRDDAPLWVSLSPHNRGNAIGTQTFADICYKWINITNMEMLRQTLLALRKREGTKEVEKMLDNTEDL